MRRPFHTARTSQNADAFIPVGYDVAYVVEVIWAGFADSAQIIDGPSSGSPAELQERAASSPQGPRSEPAGRVLQRSRFLATPSPCRPTRDGRARRRRRSASFEESCAISCPAEKRVDEP